MYGLRLWPLGGDLPVRRAATLAAQLRDGSRTMGSISRERTFGHREHLLLAILNTLRSIGGADPVDPFAERPRRMSPEELAEKLSAPRREL